MLRSEKPFQEYLPEAVQAQEAAKRRQSLEDGTEEESLPLLFVSSLPWITYDGIVQPTPSPADSNPRITWGRYRRGGNTGLSPGFPSLPPRIGRRSAYGPLLSEFRGGAGTVERIKAPFPKLHGKGAFSVRGIGLFESPLVGFLELIPEGRVGNGNECLGPLTKGFSTKLCDAVFRDHIVGLKAGRGSLGVPPQIDRQFGRLSRPLR